MNKVYNRIESITGNVITVRAKGIRNNELATISTRFGKSLAEVNKIDGDLVSLQVFAGGKGVSTGDEVRFLGQEMRVSFSEDLLGRVFNGSGEPIDKGPALTENMKPSRTWCARIYWKRWKRFWREKSYDHYTDAISDVVFRRGNGLP